MPSLDAFIDSLTKEKDKIIQMGNIKTYKDNVLAALERNNSKSKGKKKNEVEESKV